MEYPEIIYATEKVGTNGVHCLDYQNHEEDVKYIKALHREFSVPAWVSDEIKATWRAARDAGGEMDAFRIIERMVDRLGYGRTENNPSLAPNAGNQGQLPRKGTNE